jgi:hypothetical protein
MTINHNLLKTSALACSLAVVLSGCDGIAEQAGEATTETRSEAGAAPDASPPHKLTLQEQIAFSQADLAGRLGIEPESVTLSGATPVTWRSGALGCPEPGMSYTQALVPGIWIMMRADDRVYRYHAARNGEPFYCPDERAEPPVTGAGAD